MKKIKNILFYASVGLIPIGLLLRSQDYLMFGNILTTFGLLGHFVYFIINGINDYLKRRRDGISSILQILIILMSFTLFAKYLNIVFWDYPGLIIIPSFVCSSLIYLIQGKRRDIKLITISVLYLLMIIPLFGIDLYNAPRQYIPKVWYNRYDVEGNVPVNLPYRFNFKETEQLSIRAVDLKKSKEYYAAIQVFRQAIKIEPRNSMLFFDMSDCYARINELETAISIMDTAILIDSTCAPFYNNRGLMYYKLKQNDKAVLNYERAIKLDSMKGVFYSNLALVYYFQEKYDKACETIDITKRLGLHISENKIVKRIQKKYCK
jgi:tetratricopeptide (TPR) repeat protein